jgi:Ca-activated chloride channel family protein
VRDRSGKPVTSKLDAARLNEMASATGGFYVQIGPDAARDVFQRGIEPMEMTEGGVFTARQPMERYQWPLAVATACLALSVLVGDRKRRASRAVVALFGLLAFSASAQANAPGIAEYQSGQYEKAAEVFTKGLQSQPVSRQLQFNAGTATYKLGNFDQAISHFTDALLAEDPKFRENAFYNLANSLVRKGEAAKENEDKKTDWKSAIEHYSEAIKLNPDNKLAQENRDLVKKLLEDLEKQEQQKQQQKDDKKDEKKEDKKEDQKEDQKDQQKQNSEDKKDEQQKKDHSDQSDPSDQSNKSDPSNQPTPTPTPGDKKEGDLKNSQPEPKDQKPEKKEAQQAEAQEEEKQMSPAQARGLLNSLRNEEEKVNLMQQQTSQDVLRDW